jgi:predicted transcriptional regulator
MEGINYLGLIADILAIISLILAMYFYYGSRTKEIDELKNIVQNNSKTDLDELKKELREIKGSIDHLNKETFDLLKNQVSFMQQQVGQVGSKAPTKPDVEILDIVMQHKNITIETLCMHFNHIDRFIVVKYVEQFCERGTLIFDGTVIKLNDRKEKKDDES